MILILHLMTCWVVHSWIGLPNIWRQQGKRREVWLLSQGFWHYRRGCLQKGFNYKQVHCSHFTLDEELTRAAAFNDVKDALAAKICREHIETEACAYNIPLLVALSHINVFW